MFSPKKKLLAPESFDFPFQPYKIQEDLMTSLYSVIQNKQIGIYESPTGTGKSLTLTCGSIRWLLDREQLVRNELTLRIDELNKEIQQLEVNEDDTNVDWIDSQYKTMTKKDDVNNLKKIRDLIREYDEKMKNLKERITNEKKNRKENYIKRTLSEKNLNKNDDDDLTLPEYNDDNDKKVEENDEFKYKDVKIFFCSRTHSQLSQVVREIKRTVYGDKVRCISLASRQSLCINPSVRKLKSVHLMNEKCLEMCKAQCTTEEKSAAKRIRIEQPSKCLYKKSNLIENLRDTSLVDILDIEDLVKEGENLKACPYYSSREAIKDAQIIMLPYQMLLHHKTRQQTGIDLKNNIVIIDEAHNLIDSITNIYSAEVNLFQLKRALNQITDYKTKYYTQFSAKNYLRIYQIMFITKRLIKIFDNPCALIPTRMIKSYELMSEGEFTKINLYDVLQFCKKTRFVHKIHNFTKNHKNVENQTNENVSAVTIILQKMRENQAKKKANKSLRTGEIEQNENVEEVEEVIVPSVIQPLLTFLESLMESSAVGHILITNNQKDDKKCGFKFCLQDPGEHFEQIIKDCRSVIIAGGTMQPLENLKTLLFKNYEDRLKVIIFNHIVPKESILAMVVQRGPTGGNFLFNYKQRSSNRTLHELGMSIVTVCSVVPAGIVCFVTSYSFLDEVLEHFEKNHYIEQILEKKFIFRETQEANTTEDTLKQYANAIKDNDKNGAIIFSIIGGKLSEGLNFTDDLGRCVIVIGMPYPATQSAELIGKLDYLDKNMFRGAGREYYNDICMRSVNQCIGRSIRHINDYATILLFDQRYLKSSVQTKLAFWVRENMQMPKYFGEVHRAMAEFFPREHRSRN